MSPEATGQHRAEWRAKSDCGLKGLKRLKRHHPKPVPTFGLDCVLHALVPCLSTDSPMTDSQSFPGSPAPVFFIFSLLLELRSVPAPPNWAYIAAFPLGRLWHWDWAEPIFIPPFSLSGKGGSHLACPVWAISTSSVTKNIRSQICHMLNAEMTSEYHLRALCPRNALPSTP